MITRFDTLRWDELGPLILFHRSLDEISEKAKKDNTSFGGKKLG